MREGRGTSHEVTGRDVFDRLLVRVPPVSALLFRLIGRLSWDVRAIADGGDRIAVQADFVGYGRGSGVQMAVNGGGTAIRLSPRGLVAWQEWSAEQGGSRKALEAVGLSEQDAHPGV